MAITPERLAQTDNEHDHQAAFFCWLALNFRNEPRLRMAFAIPNGGERNRIVASRLVAEGTRSGVPDVFLPVPATILSGWQTFNYHGLFIEFKKPAVKLKRGPNGPGPWDYGGVSDDQKLWLDALEAQGYRCAVVYGWTEARDLVKQYLGRNDL